MATWWLLAKPSCLPRGCFRLSPARLFAPHLLLPPLNRAPPRGLGSTWRFLSKGYLCKRCLVPPPAQPRSLQPFLLDAEARGSSARRSGVGLSSRGRHAPPCSGSVPWGTGDAALPLPHLQPLCSAAFLWKHGNVDTPSASPRGFSLPGASSASSWCHLVPWDPPRERKGFHGKPSSHRGVPAQPPALASTQSSEMLLPAQPKVSKAAHQGQDPVYALSCLPVLACPCHTPWHHGP